jgi:hypothetical protein
MHLDSLSVEVEANPHDFSTSEEFWASMISYSFLSFGTHYMRSSLSIFAIYLISDHFITPGGYSILTNASFIPALFIPAISGYFLDHCTIGEKIWYLVELETVPILAQVLFAYSVSHGSYTGSIIALVLFGFGASALVAAQRTLMIERFKGYETLVTGCYISSAAIARLMGLTFTAPIVVSHLQ